MIRIQLVLAMTVAAVLQTVAADAAVTLPYTSGLDMWLDASNTASLVAQDGSLDDGDALSAWNSSGLASIDATQANVTRQPTWIENVAGLGGKSAVEFSGATNGTYMGLSSLSMGSNTTVFFVSQNAVQTATGSAHRPLLAANNNPYRADGDGYGIGYRREGSNAVNVSLGNGTSEQSLSHTLAASGQFEVITYAKASTAATLRRSGYQVAANTQQDPLTAYHTGYNLGADPNDSTRYYAGQMAEVLVYDHALGETERDAVENYLHMKYGLWEAPYQNQLHVWLDGGSVQSTGGQVSQWTDKSGNENHFTQTDVEYQPTVGTGYNGHTTVAFDSSDQRLFNTTLQLDGDLTIFIVAQNSTQDTGGSIHRAILAPDNGPYRGDGNGYGLGYYADGSDGFNVSLGEGTGGTSEQNVNYYLEATEAFEVIAFRRDGPGLAELFRDGLLMDSSNQIDPVDGFNIGYLIGGDPSNAARFYQGQIAEILIYNRALTDDEMLQVQDYLDAKYVPEPSTWALSILGLLGLAVWHRRRPPRP